MFVLVLCLTAGSCSPPAEHPAPGTPYVEWLGEWGEEKRASKPPDVEHYFFGNSLNHPTPEEAEILIARDKCLKLLASDDPEYNGRLQKWLAQHRIAPEACETLANERRAAINPPLPAPVPNPAAPPVE